MAKETALGKKIRTLRLKREKTQCLDQAQYLSVSTGRLEPYLRELAAATLYAPKETRIWTADDGTSFLGLYATALRARAAHATQLAPQTTLHPSDSPTQLDSQTSLKYVIQMLQSHWLGLIIDPGYPTELTIEPHHQAQLQSLLEQRKCESALTAIGNESLHCEPPTDAERQALAQQHATRISQLNAQNLRLCACTITLYGFGNNPRWNILYVIDQNSQFAPFPPEMYAELPKLTIYVDPSQPGWERNLLWEYRNQAEPIH